MAKTNQIQQVADKVQLLLKHYHESQKNLQKLFKENASLQQQLADKNDQVAKLQQSVEALRLTSSNLNEDVKKDLEKRINTYLREIDNCIALLNG